MSYIEIIEDSETFDLAIGESSFTLRRFDSQIYRDIEKRHTTRTKNLRQGGWIKEVDDFAVNEDLLDHMIVAWKDIKSPLTGQDVECTKDMKNKLPGSVKVQIIEACDADSISTGNPEGKKKT